MATGALSHNRHLFCVLVLLCRVSCFMFLGHTTFPPLLIHTQISGPVYLSKWSNAYSNSLLVHSHSFPQQINLFIKPKQKALLRVHLAGLHLYTIECPPSIGNTQLSLQHQHGCELWLPLFFILPSWDTVPAASRLHNFLEKQAPVLTIKQRDKFSQVLSLDI